MIYFQFLQNENSQLLKFSFNNFQISLSVCQAVSKLIFILPCCVLDHRSGSTFSLLVQFSSILLLTTYRCLISGKRKRKMPGRLSKHAPVEGFCLDTMQDSQVFTDDIPQPQNFSFILGRAGLRIWCLNTKFTKMIFSGGAKFLRDFQVGIFNIGGANSFSKPGGNFLYRWGTTFQVGL